MKCLKPICIFFFQAVVGELTAPRVQWQVDLFESDPLSVRFNVGYALGNLLSLAALHEKAAAHSLEQGNLITKLKSRQMADEETHNLELEKQKEKFNSLKHQLGKQYSKLEVKLADIKAQLEREKSAKKIVIEQNDLLKSDNTGQRKLVVDKDNLLNEKDAKIADLEAVLHENVDKDDERVVELTTQLKDAGEAKAKVAEEFKGQFQKINDVMKETVDALYFKKRVLVETQIKVSQKDLAVQQRDQIIDVGQRVLDEQGVVLNQKVQIIADLKKMDAKRLAKMNQLSSQSLEFQEDISVCEEEFQIMLEQVQDFGETKKELAQKNLKISKLEVDVKCAKGNMQNEIIRLTGQKQRFIQSSSKAEEENRKVAAENSELRLVDIFDQT